MEHPQTPPLLGLAPNRTLFPLCNASPSAVQPERFGVTSPALSPRSVTAHPLPHCFPLLWYKEVQNKLLFMMGPVIINNNAALHAPVSQRAGSVPPGPGDLVQLNYSRRFITSCF